MKIITAIVFLTTIFVGCSTKPKTPQEQVIGKWQLDKLSLYRTSIGKEIIYKNGDKADTTIFDFPIISSIDINKQGDFFAYEENKTLMKSQWKVEPKKLLLKSYSGDEQSFVLDTLTDKILVLAIEFSQMRNVREDMELDKLFSKGNRGSEPANDPRLQSLIDEKKREIETEQSESFEQLLKKGKVTKLPDQTTGETGKEIRKYYFVKK
jgi:hypothetical protein